MNVLLPKALFLLLVGPLLGVEPVFVTVGPTAYPATTIIGASAATATASVVFGGLGDTPNAAWAGKVVLLDRGGVDFFVKVNSVQAAGGVAAIVANNVPGAAPVWSLGTGKSSTLPAVAVTKDNGAALRLAEGATARVGSAAPPAPPPIPPLVPVLPDPAKHVGEGLVSDGTNWVTQKAPDPWGAVSMELAVEIGKPVTVAMSATGSPPFTYHWVKDGTSITGGTTAVLSIASFKATDAGKYICIVGNSTSSTPSGTLILTAK